LKVTEDMSVHELKVLVANELNIPVERQRLMFKGKPMHGMMVYLSEFDALDFS